MIALQGRSQIINHDETLCVVRDSNTIYVDGMAQKRSTSTFNITCNVQPLNGKDLLLVPEGDRLKEQYWVWSQNFDKVTEVTVTDRVIRHGIQFQVQESQAWGSYNRARIMRIDVGAYATT
jgi:hypothetical protein